MVRRIISLLLCGVMFMVVLSGCSREEPPAPTETVAPTQEPTQAVEEVELTFPGDARPYLGVELEFLTLLEVDDPRVEVMEQAADVFETRTGAKVKFYWLGNDESVLAANLEGGVKVDIFGANLDSLQNTFAQYTLDLTDLAEAADYARSSHEVLRRQVVERCGNLAGIPQTPVLYGMYYNEDSLAESGVSELPGTWEELLSFSEALVQAGFMPMAMDIESCHVALELLLERQFGYEQFETLMIQSGWTWDTAYIDVFKRAIDYAGAGYLAKGDPSAFPSGQEKLTLSNVVMVPGTSEICVQVERGTLMDVNWGVFPYPGDGPGKGFGVESQTLSIHKNCENPQAAFDFIMLLTTGAFDQLYADLGNGIPADPGNDFSLTGARELLAQADTRGMGLLGPENNELFSRLWNGWYKTAGYFASAMNELDVNRQPKVTQGVG